jgi:zinc protease
LVQEFIYPFTSASIGSGIYLNEIKYAEITGKSNPENWEESLAIIEQTLRRAIKYGFTSSELERVKKDFISALDNAVKKASTRNSSNLARKIIWSLNGDRVIMSPEQSKEMYSPLISSLTLKKVHDALKKAWKPDHRLILVTGNTDLTNKDVEPREQVLAIYNKSKSAEVSRPIESKPVIFPYLPEPEKESSIVLRKEIPDIGIIQINFKNGIRLNLKKTDFKANEVLVNLSFGLGKSSEPPDMPGLAPLSRNVINESGLGTLTKDEIKRALAGKNTSVTFSIGEDRFYIKGRTVTKEVALMFQLLYAYLLDTGFKEYAYSITMERFKQRYQKLSSSIEGAMTLHGKRFLAGGDSRFGLPAYEKFQELTLDHVRSWIKTSLQTDNMEVSVVGDFDTDSVVKIASKYLGNLSFEKTAIARKTSKQIQFPVKQSQKILVETEIPKGLIVVAYPSEDLWDISRTRRFSILADIVTDRLREKIREKLGSAYSTYAYNKSSRFYQGYGVFQVVVHIDPEEAELIIREVKKIISDIVENGVTQEELKRAKAPTLTSIKDMMRKNHYWLNTVLTGSKQYPQQIEWNNILSKSSGTGQL